jgi:hypothetical protein
MLTVRDTNYKVYRLIDDQLPLIGLGLGSRALAALASTGSLCPPSEHFMCIRIDAHFLHIAPFEAIFLPYAK